ncbi:YkvA family protein [Litchfieldia alkalitelluris]|uniref:YkvA family protein n=1 Tax=Litchfieldia alkalitelluris TaxID=304268 RepID=UPI0009970012
MLKNPFKKKTDLEVVSSSTIDDVDKIEIEDELVDDLKDEEEKLKVEDINSHEEHFSEEKFWTKVQKFSKKAGTSVVYAVLLLYYTLQRPDVPLKVKATIVGALGYFILPLDIIPDLAVGVGYTDDLSVVIFALVQVALYVNDEIKMQAKNKLKDLFGENVDTTEIDNKLGR